MKKLLSRLLSVSLLSLSLAACGEAVCSDAESAATKITQRQKDCAPAGSTYAAFTVDKTKCDVSIKACSGDEKTKLAKSYACINNLPACTADTFAQFQTSINACSTAGLEGVSDACKATTAAYTTVTQQTK